MTRPKNKRTKKTAAPVIAPVSAPVSAPVNTTAAAPVGDTVTEAAPAAAEAPAEAPKQDVFVIQSSGREYTMSDITELCKAAYRNGGTAEIISCDVYLKAENGGLRAYYVINGTADGAYIDL